MMIDTNAYIGSWPYWAVRYLDAYGDGMVALMDQYHVDKSVATSLCSVFYDDAEGNEMLFKAAARHPDRLIPAVSISTVTDRDNRTYLRACAERGARVLRLFPFYHSYAFINGNKKLETLIETAGELGLAVDIPLRIMMNFGLAAIPVSQIDGFVRQHRGVNFIVSNFNSTEYFPLVELAETTDNVFLGTSALSRYEGIRDMTRRIGSGKVLCGLTAPLQYPACGISKIVHSGLNETEIADILGNSAAALLGIQ